jgi:hypothetical protein
MSEQGPLDLEAIRAIVSDVDLGDPAAMARALAALPPDIVELAAGMLASRRGPFTVQSVDESKVPGMVVLDLPDDEVLLIDVEKYEAARRSIAETTGVPYEEVDLAGLRLMLDDQGVPMLEPPIN